MNSKLVDIQTEYGPIQGCVKENVLGRDYFNFQRIPYMRPPIGKLRFRDPQEPEAWTETLDCTEECSPFCNVNFLTGQYEGQLDAMYINIYTNQIKPTKPYPVMVWIHAGGVHTGNASKDFYGPDYLIQKDVVVVTFQYRMGVFGFLSLDDPSLNIPGNAQFRDHVFALKWIQRNIENFGGDPNNVTLFGESWGGGATGYHMISNMSKGLFHRGIQMSGSALNTVHSLIPRRNWALRLCQQLGYSGPTDEKDLFEFLEKTDEKEIVMASTKILTKSEMGEENLVAPFGPTIEPYDKGNVFLSDEIMKMSAKCWGNGIDVMIGATSNEMLGLDAIKKVDDEYEKYVNFNRYVFLELGLNIDDPKRIEYGKKLMKNYYGLLTPSKTNLEGTMHAVNDNSIWHPMSRIVRSREKSNQGGKSFVYRFDIDSENNLFKKHMNISDKYREPVHGDDIFYLFKSTLGPVPAIHSVGFSGIKLMISVFAEFAANGNPNVPELGDEVEWEPATFDEPLKGLNINEKECAFMTLPEAERIKVFDEIFMAENKNLY